MIDGKKLYKWIKAEINPYGKPFEGTVFEFGNKVMEHIVAMENQPQADKWIPCEERLPSEEGFYLVSVGAPYKPIRVYMYKKVGDEFKWFDGSVGCALLPHFVEAWQPLPTPYKKEGAENGIL